MGWRGYIDEAHGTVFYWSQKAACTTLFSFLAANMATPPAQKKYFHQQSVPVHRCREAIARRRLRSVILARHPVSRITSAYFNKFCLYQGRRLRHRDDLEPFAQELHDLYCARSGRQTQANIMTFEAFLDTVAALHAARAAPHTPVNGHWETQVPAYLADEIRYDRILRVETLDADMTALAAELGMTWQPRAENRTADTDRPRHPGYLGDLPARDVADYGFGTGNFVTPATLQRIGAIYAVDFRVLGYPPAP